MNIEREGVSPAQLGMRNVIAAVDCAAIRRIAETHSELLDYVAPRLSRLANHGLLWIAVAAGLRATGDRWARRAAWRGLGSLTIASTAVNIVGKSLATPEPPARGDPRPRQLAGSPGTTSFRPGTPRPRPLSPSA